MTSVKNPSGKCSFGELCFGEINFGEKVRIPTTYRGMMVSHKFRTIPLFFFPSTERQTLKGLVNN